MSDDAQQDPKKERRDQLIAGGVIATTVLAMFALYVWTKVCDEQITSTGNVVTVCRHVQATDAPILALGVILLVGLGAFFTEISIFGLTVKRQLEEVRKNQNKTDKRVDETAEKLDETAADAADFHASILAQQAVPLGSSEQLSAEQHPDIIDLAERYNQLRWTMPSGSSRTIQMTQVVREMRDILRDTSDFDVLAHLNHSDRGVRLAAYAYLNEQDAPEHFHTLVDAVVTEDKPFGQYWGLLAVAHQFATGAARLDDDTQRKLSILRSRVGLSTDRAQVLNGILA